MKSLAEDQVANWWHSWDQRTHGAPAVKLPSWRGAPSAFHTPPGHRGLPSLTTAPVCGKSPNVALERKSLATSLRRSIFQPSVVCRWGECQAEPRACPRYNPSCRGRGNALRGWQSGNLNLPPWNWANPGHEALQRDGHALDPPIGRASHASCLSF